MSQNFMQSVPYLIPIILLQLILTVIALVDLLRREKVIGISITPIVSTTLLCLIFTAVAILRFQREEF